MKKKSFIKKYWDMSLIIIAYVFVLVMALLFSGKIDFQTWKVIISIAHIILVTGFIATLINTFRLKEKRTLRIIVLIVIGLLYIIGKSYSGILT